MKRLGWLFALGASGVCLEAHGAVGVCGFFADAYRQEVKAKIQAGIPFELMGALFEDGTLAYKRTVRISYNLWDEIVTVKSGDQVLAKSSLKQGAEGICRHLEVDEPLRPGRRYTYRLLLNPMWGERVARLQISTGRELDNRRIIGIDWKKLAEEMPSDKVLLEKEIQP